MPNDNAAAWNTAATLASTAANNWAASDLSRKQRKFAEQQAKIQRQQALEDWNMQNEYNSPTAVMKRLRDAKLNPMLIYGKGPGEMVSGPIRSTEQAKWNPGQRDFSGIGQSMERYFTTKMMMAQMDNLKAQNTVLLEDAALKRAQAIATEVQAGKGRVDTERAKFDLDFERGLQEISAEARKASLDQLKANTQINLARNEREIAANSQTIAESVARIARMRIQNSNETETVKQQKLRLISDINRTTTEMLKVQSSIMNDDLDRQLKQLDIDLKEKGIQPGDELWQRIVARLLENLGIDAIF